MLYRRSADFWDSVVLKVRVMRRWYIRYPGCERERRRCRERWMWGHCAPDESTGRSGDPQTTASWCNSRTTDRSWSVSMIRPNVRRTSAALNPSRNENTTRSLAAARIGRSFHQFTHGALDLNEPLGSLRTSIFVRIVSASRAPSSV